MCRLDDRARRACVPCSGRHGRRRLCRVVRAVTPAFIVAPPRVGNDAGETCAPAAPSPPSLRHATPKSHESGSSRLCRKREGACCATGHIRAVSTVGAKTYGLRRDGNIPLCLIWCAEAKFQVVRQAGQYLRRVGGGAHGGGSVIELSPGARGQWTETILYSFCASAHSSASSRPHIPQDSGKRPLQSLRT